MPLRLTTRPTPLTLKTSYWLGSKIRTVKTSAPGPTIFTFLKRLIPVPTRVITRGTLNTEGENVTVSFGDAAATASRKLQSRFEIQVELRSSVRVTITVSAETFSARPPGRRNIIVKIETTSVVLD